MFYFNQILFLSLCVTFESLSFAINRQNKIYSSHQIGQNNIYKYTRKNPLVCKLKDVIIIGKYDDSCEFYHVTLSHQQPFNFFEGQYCTIIPPDNHSNGTRYAPRAYSIASTCLYPQPVHSANSALYTFNTSSQIHDKEFSLCIRKFINPKTNAPGICSSYLINSKPNDLIYTCGPFGKINIRDYLSKLTTCNTNIPNKHKPNIILIATGTGIAPFRSFYKYIFNNFDNQVLDAFDKLLLIFGVKNEYCLLYHDELTELQEKFPDKFFLIKAFSRSSPRKYVYDVLADNYDFIKSFIDFDTKIFLCGTKNMILPIKQVLSQLTSSDVYNNILNNMSIEVY